MTGFGVSLLIGGAVLFLVIWAATREPKPPSAAASPTPAPAESATASSIESGTPEIRKAKPVLSPPSNGSLERDRFDEFAAVARKVPHERLRIWPVGSQIGMDLLVKRGLSDAQLAELIRWYVSVNARVIFIFDNAEHARNGECPIASYMASAAGPEKSFTRFTKACSWESHEVPL
jgi:hypothetical protein